MPPRRGEKCFSGNMKRWLAHHPQVLLTALTIVFVGILGFSAIWTLHTLVRVVGVALRSPEPQTVTEQFDIEGARSLNLRGLAQ